MRRTLEELQQLVYDRTDADEAYFTLAKCTRALSTAIASLHSFITERNPDFFTQKLNLTIAGGADGTALPDGVFHVRKVETGSSGSWTPLDMFQLEDRDNWQGRSVSSTGDPLFAIMGNRIYFDNESWTGIVRLWYVPDPAELNEATPQQELDYPRSWVSYLVTKAAIIYADFAKEDPGSFYADLTRIEKQIASTVKVVKGHPVQVRDEYARRGYGRLRTRWGAYED
jgi:hypothetical protein